MEDFVTFEIAKKLKEKGFNEGCEYTFYNNYRVRDEIYEKHPGLSDDGYEDLRKKYGGPYKDEEVYGYYIEPLKLYSRNSTIGVNPVTKQKVPTNQLCSCPNIYQVLKWLRKEKKLYVGVTYSPKIEGSQDFFYATIQYIGDYKKTIYPDDSYDRWEEAALNGIEYAIDNLI